VRRLASWILRSPLISHRSEGYLLLLEEHHLLLDEADLGLHYLWSHGTTGYCLDVVLDEVRLSTGPIIVHLVS